VDIEGGSTNAEHPAAEGAMGLIERAAHKIEDALT
jgi:hypothetical protein